MTEIHVEMSELLDTQVNVQNGSLFWGSRKFLQAHEKMCDENERRKKEKMTNT